MGSDSKSENKKSSQLVPLLLDWFAVNARDLPWRRTRDPYAVWVSEIMLQQTQVKTVIPFWERWMRELPTIEAAAQVDSAKLHKLWEGLGYYTRVRNLQKAAKQIVEGGVQSAEGDSTVCRSRGDEAQIKKKSETPDVVPYKFPDKFEDVLALPGIGRYTAGAICSIAFNQPTPILDGNVIRVLTRLYGIAENPKEKGTNERLWALAGELVSVAGGVRLRRTLISDLGSTESRPTGKENFCSRLNQSLMELGALVCTPRAPQCLVCPVKKFCVAFREGRVEELPNLGKRPEATARRFWAFVIGRDGKFLVQQRPVGVVNAHLWEFPNVEVGFKSAEPAEVLAEMNLLAEASPESAQVTPLITVKHSITRYRITLEAFRVEAGAGALPGKAGSWKTLAQLKKLAFSAAHKKILSAL